ncbi:hypothetical protein BDZ90DRAFT_247796 [Jaminaea rosea]|uniref:Peroxisomal membrane protein PEX13 n=1 Tax=Jaminaea rosea TaxID=1569628 RepID=A0A316UY32_9BASI|nr:hypothetical protein BDZ90DRAFT_247796 [Jaminaea rosea]PWN30216.1 hypothetical protein BDZ90DRAFT_247796 [Jaminaea rosea]
MPAAPPKPWERAGAAGSAATTTTAAPSTVASTAAPVATAAGAPAVPERPSSLASTSAADPYGSTGAYSSALNRPGMAGMTGMSGMSGYGGGYGGAYGSPYSRMGGYGGYGMGGYGGYGGMGGYGSGYGGLGGYGGMGGYGMGMGGYGMGGMPGMPGGMPGQEMSLTQRMESGTQATFELISSIVGAFGGFAQMLESTFMATHSSFFAMVGVADQFASLRNYLGQVLSIFALARWLKGLLLKVTGRAPPANGQPGKAKPSKRPLVVFFLAVVGLPYLMGKLVRLITQRQEAERLRLEAEQQTGQQAGHLSLPDGASIDPSKLSFVRALYTYESSDPLELSLRPNDIVAVLSKVDPSSGQESSWWRGRTRDGRIGWFPSTYVESLETVKQRAAGKGVAEEGKAVEGQAAASPAATTPAAVSVKS